jgi:hypothetical protein
MDNSYGHLEGVITKIEKHTKGYTTFEVLAINGVTCYASDFYGIKRPFPIELGMKICLEEATIMFDNGQINYCVDEELSGVAINDVYLENFMPK